MISSLFSLFLQACFLDGLQPHTSQFFPVLSLKGSYPTRDSEENVAQVTKRKLIKS